MRVLYVSKALTVAAYRDKLRALNDHVQVAAAMPRRWGSQTVEPTEPGSIHIDRYAVLLHGHNQLHIYWRPDLLLERTRPDLVHIDEEPYSAAAFQISLLCSRRGIPCLVFAWQNLDKTLPAPFRAMRSAVFRRVAGAIAGTEAAAEVLAGAGYDNPLVVIPQFGVDPARYRPDPAARAHRRATLGIGSGDFLIGFVGRLVREKGVHLLLSALQVLREAHLVIVGSGPEREQLARAAKSSGLRDRVHFVGRVSSSQIPSWLPAFDVVVLFSISGSGWTEQFGRVLIEAMACGVPVVGSDSGEIPRVIGEAGCVVPEGDWRALAMVLQGLAESSAQRRHLASAGRARVDRLYTHDHIAARTAEFYQTLVRPDA